MLHTTDGPGIDITKLKVGTILFIETEDEQLFEMTVVTPDRGMVEVTSTEERLKKPVVGIVTHSFSNGPQQARDDKRQRNLWIGLHLRMALLFKNGDYVSKPVIHATVRTPGWSYDVF